MLNFFEPPATFEELVETKGESVAAAAIDPENGSVSAYGILTCAFFGYLVTAALSAMLLRALRLIAKCRPLTAFERQCTSMVLFVYSVLKVIALFVIELIVFPIFAGFLVDFFTVDFIGGTIQGRLDWLYAHPYTTLPFHYVIGFSVLITLSTLVRYATLPISHSTTIFLGQFARSYAQACFGSYATRTTRTGPLCGSLFRILCMSTQGSL